jgi:3-dehydroquinate synthetase
VNTLSIPELNTEIVFLEQLCDLSLDFKNCFLIYDKKLEQYELLKAFLEKGWHRSIAVASGEELKSLSFFSEFLAKESNHLKTCPASKPVFVALGGGSVGDFVGFLASVYQRGCPLVHIPSNWLSSIDSAHGGKTALNTDNGKNQIGSFHQAEKIFIAKDLLFQQPMELFWDALSEILKMYMLIEDERKFALGEDPTPDEVMHVLRHCIEQKYLWVKKDPYEKTGLRRVLNLGHTMGHAFEASLHLSHGKSVALGLCFCLRYSFAKQKIKEERYQRLVDIFQKYDWWRDYQQALKNISTDKVRSLLMADKKRESSDELVFIFLTDTGHETQKVPNEELILFLKEEIANV